MAVSERLRLRALGGDWRRVAATDGARQRDRQGRSKPASQQSGVPRRKAASEQSRGEGTKDRQAGRQVKRPPTTVRNVNVDGESEGLCVCV